MLGWARSWIRFSRATNKWALPWVHPDSISLPIITTAWHATSSPIIRLLFLVPKGPSVSWLNMAYYFTFLLSFHWMSITTPEQIRAQLWAHHFSREAQTGTKTVSWPGLSLSPSLKWYLLWKIYFDYIYYVLYIYCGWSKLEFRAGWI